MIENIELGKLIGKGTHGTVVEANWEGSMVAVKKIHSIFNEANGNELELQFESLQERFVKECERIIKLRHTNIVQFLGISIPPGARVASLVMERLYCNYYDLLGKHANIPLEIKLNLLHGISLGLRYLHSRSPPIVHHNLCSKSILVSKGMEAKISVFSTINIEERSLLTTLPLDTQDFMPPEALTDTPNRRCGTELDVFSLGCVMLHTFSHQWPTPQNIISDSPTHSHTELKRRSQYLKAIPVTLQDLMLPIITGCLENNPDSRPGVANICAQLESLITNRKLTLPESMLHAHLLLQEAKQEIKDHTVKLCSKGAELHSKTEEVEILKSEISKLQISGSAPKQV